MFDPDYKIECIKPKALESGKRTPIADNLEAIQRAWHAEREVDTSKIPTIKAA